MNELNQLELPILNRIAEVFHCDFLDFLMPKITMLGDDGIFWISIAVILLFFKKTRKTGILLGASFLMGFLVGNLCLKNLTARIRPYDMPGALLSLERGELLVKALSDFSFPSGHTLVCTEAATVLMMRERKPWGIIATVIAALVMFSRLYLYVHYPLDVLAGAILGVLFGILSVKLVSILYDRIEAAIMQKRAACASEKSRENAN